MCVLAGPTWLDAESLSPQVLKDGKVRLSFVGPDRSELRAGPCLQPDFRQLGAPGNQHCRRGRGAVFRQHA